MPSAMAATTTAKKLTSSDNQSVPPPQLRTRSRCRSPPEYRRLSDGTRQPRCPGRSLGRAGGGPAADTTRACARRPGGGILPCRLLSTRRPPAPRRSSARPNPAMGSACWTPREPQAQIAAPSERRSGKKAPFPAPLSEALCRTRTGDPFLTIDPEGGLLLPVDRGLCLQTDGSAAGRSSANGGGDSAARVSVVCLASGGPPRLIGPRAGLCALESMRGRTGEVTGHVRRWERVMAYPTATRHGAMLLRAHGLTVREIADRIGIPYGTVGRWVRGVERVAFRECEQCGEMFVVAARGVHRFCDSRGARVPIERGCRVRRRRSIGRRVGSAAKICATAVVAAPTAAVSTPRRDGVCSVGSSGGRRYKCRSGSRRSLGAAGLPRGSAETRGAVKCGPSGPRRWGRRRRASRGAGHLPAPHRS